MELLTAYQQPVHVELKMHRVYEELVRCAVPKKETGFITGPDTDFSQRRLHKNDSGCAVT